MCLEAKYLNGIFCIGKVPTSKLCLADAGADESLVPEAAGRMQVGLCFQVLVIHWEFLGK